MLNAEPGSDGRCVCSSVAQDSQGSSWSAGLATMTTGQRASIPSKLGFCQTTRKGLGILADAISDQGLLGGSQRIRCLFVDELLLVAACLGYLASMLRQCLCIILHGSFTTRPRPVRRGTPWPVCPCDAWLTLAAWSIPWCTVRGLRRRCLLALETGVSS